MKLVREEEIQAIEVPGRSLKWLITPEQTSSEHLSMCLIRVPAGQTVRPAHSHPNGEELIFIISGNGRVMVDSEVEPVAKGTAVLFPVGSIHMLQNSGEEEMEVACFFAPPSDLSTYKFFENVSFPQRTNP